MNSEEIKEIGQMFLNISNQNHNMNLGLTDEDIIRGVTNQMEEKLEEFKKNFKQEIQEAYATNAIPRLNKLDEAIKELKDNPHLAGFEHIKNRLESAIEASRKFREEMREKLHNLEIKDTPVRTHRNKAERDEYQEFKKEYQNKIGELGTKIGGYGGLISSLQKKEGERTEELNKIRKDYRELQDEMWERFKLTEAWIETKDSAGKDRIRAEILEQKKQNKLSDVLTKTYQEKQEARVKLDATNEQDVLDKTYSDTRKAALEVLQRKADNEKPKNKWLNWETPTSLAWGKTPISKLDLSVRSHNALIIGGYHYVGNIITQSPHDLIQIRNFGRKCLREVMKALEEKNLTLNMQKFKEQRTERYAKENTQRGNLYGIKQ